MPLKALFLVVKTFMQYFICNALPKDLEVLPANEKVGFVSKGNCILPVDLCCMKFRHHLNILKKKQMCRPK